MFRPTPIKTGFANLLGWRQDYDQDKEIDSELTASDSGQFYQDIHPLITLENIRAITPDFEDVTTTTTFSDWLEQKTQASNLRALQNIYTDKLASKTAKNVFKQAALFDGVGSIKDTIADSSNLVGFELSPLRSNGVTLKIESIGLQFAGTGDVVLYLFHSSRNEPLKTITIPRTRNNSMEWFSQNDLYLPYQDDTVDAGGSYYLMYEQNETNSQLAINKLKNWSEAPCGTCNSNDINSYKNWSPYVCVSPFKTSSLEGTLELWDIDDNIYTYDTNYGINLKVSVECDVTNIFLENKLNFQTVIGLQMAYDMIKEFAYNPNYKINRTDQNFSKNELLYELNGTNEDYVNSISYLLKQAYKAVSIDLTNMSRECFLCSFKVRRKTI